jgi:hypothetical protein
MLTRISMLLLLFVAVVWAPAVRAQQPAHANSTLTVRGQSGQAPVIQQNGRSYVDVEALARITQGTLAFQADRIVLTLPGPPSSDAAAKTPTPPKADFSREFVPAAIEELIAIREWRVAITSTVQKGAPVAEDWVSGYRRTADNKQTLAAAAASTDADHKTLALLQGEFGKMQAMSDRFLQLHDSASYIRPDSLDNDTQDQQIKACASGLTGMIASGQFGDVIACH